MASASSRFGGHWEGADEAIAIGMSHPSHASRWQETRLIHTGCWPAAPQKRIIKPAKFHKNVVADKLTFADKTCFTVRILTGPGWIFLTLGLAVLLVKPIL